MAQAHEIFCALCFKRDVGIALRLMAWVCYRANHLLTFDDRRLIYPKRRNRRRPPASARVEVTAALKSLLKTLAACRRRTIIGTGPRARGTSRQHLGSQILA
jgi:hypothetical protein